MRTTSVWLCWAVLSTLVACGKDDGASASGASSSSGTVPGAGGATAAGAGGSSAAGGASAGGTSAGAAGNTSGGNAGSSGNSGSTGVSGAAGSAGSGGTAPVATGGTPARPQLTGTEAASYTVLEYLARGGSVIAPARDDWDPTAGAGDVTAVTPTYEVAESGGTHTTVQAAIDAAVTGGGAERVYIAVAAGEYREVVCVPSGAPPITLYGTGAAPSQTVIVFDNYNGKAKEVGEPANPCNANLSGTTFGTSGSATFAAYANDFHAKNLTISNDAEESAIGSGTQAVALMTQGDKLVFEDVRLLGNQDTLYVKTPNADTIARAYFKACYVEGDVDFIFGRGTFVLDGCTVHYLTARQGTKGGYIVAPSTDARNPFGILIVGAEFTAEEGTPDGIVNLGRAWDESQKDLSTYATNVATGIYPNGQATIRDSTLGIHVDAAAPWHSSTVDRPYSSAAGTYPANRFYEFGNDGPGSTAP